MTARGQLLADPDDRPAHHRPRQREFPTCSSRIGTSRCVWASSRRNERCRRGEPARAAIAAASASRRAAITTPASRGIDAAGSVTGSNHQSSDTSDGWSSTTSSSARDQRQVAAAERLREVPPVEDREVHLHLVGGAGKGRDQREVAAGVVSEVVDEGGRSATGIVSTCAAASATVAR